MQEFVDSGELFTTWAPEGIEGIRSQQKIAREYSLPVEVVFHHRVYWIRKATTPLWSYRTNAG